MKKLVFAISFFMLCVSYNAYGQKHKVSVREIYYQVSDNGEVNERKTLGEQDLVFAKGRGLIHIEYRAGFRHDLEAREVDFYTVGSITKRSKKETRVYDDNKRLVKCTEQTDSLATVNYQISYNPYDDPIEIKSVRENSDGTSSILPTITIEYFYFCEMPPIKPSEKEIDKYYKCGVIPSERGCPWMLRTLKKDGVTIQHAERKYGNDKKRIRSQKD